MRMYGFDLTCGVDLEEGNMVRYRCGISGTKCVRLNMDRDLCIFAKALEVSRAAITLAVLMHLIFVSVCRHIVFGDQHPILDLYTIQNVPFQCIYLENG